MPRVTAEGRDVRAKSALNVKNIIFAVDEMISFLFFSFHLITPCFMGTGTAVKPILAQDWVGVPVKPSSRIQRHFPKSRI